MSDFEGELYRLCIERCQAVICNSEAGAETLSIVMSALATTIAALTLGNAPIADATARSAGAALPTLVARRVHLFGAPDGDPTVRRPQ